MNTLIKVKEENKERIKKSNKDNKFLNFFKLKVIFKII
jgi:hypothetical protein